MGHFQAFYRFFRLGLFLVVLLTQGFSALARSYAPHEGYLSSVEKERDQTVSDLVVVPFPAENGPTLKEKIFNPELSKEFKESYEQKFGRTEQQQILNPANKNLYYDNLYGIRGTDQDVNDERRKFGEYMVRRLLEFHVDNYAKSDPKIRPVWEAKERLSKVEVPVGPQMHLDVRYSIAGNTMDVFVKNPWVRAKVTVQMNPAVFGPGPVDEIIYSLGKDVTKTVSLEADYKSIDGIVAYIGRKNLTERLSATLTTSTFTHDGGQSVRESLYLAGLNYVY